MPTWSIAAMRATLYFFVCMSGMSPMRKGAPLRVWESPAIAASLVGRFLAVTPASASPLTACKTVAEPPISRDIAICERAAKISLIDTHLMIQHNLGPDSLSVLTFFCLSKSRVFRIAAIRTKRVIHVMPPVTEIAIEEPKAPFVWLDYFLRFIAVESK
jgi:hypothetical protein